VFSNLLWLSQIAERRGLISFKLSRLYTGVSRVIAQAEEMNNLKDRTLTTFQSRSVLLRLFILFLVLGIGIFALIQMAIDAVVEEFAAHPEMYFKWAEK
jgi:hypothetical protein